MGCEHRDKAWQRYDEVFHQSTAVNPNLLWGRHDLELWMKATIPMEEANPAANGGTVANCYNGAHIDSDSLALKLIEPRSSHIVILYSTLGHVSLLACSVHAGHPHEVLHIYWVLVSLNNSNFSTDTSDISYLEGSISQMLERTYM